MPNMLSALPATLPDELTDTLVQAKHVRIERIVSRGHASPVGFWYDQEENEFVLLIQGAARLRFEDEVVEIKAGDHPPSTKLDRNALQTRQKWA